ncbi:MAG: TldD/PmbA family protein [Gammaproteobacteria bacterium]|nr:TldD/PmbA family protein [Gammaproteobacteria bacterium]MBT6549898.1 TldD/PmbA family protein [Gammaproteobacteria bacterium]
MNKQPLTGLVRDLNGYAELRLQENRNSSIMLLNGDLVANNKQIKGGISARSFYQGCWGFASYPEADESAINKVIKAAADNAKLLGKRAPGHVQQLIPAGFSGEFDFTSKRPVVSSQHKIEYVRSVDAYIADNYPDLMARRVMLRTEDMEKQLSCTAGSEAYSMIPRSMLYIFLTAENGQGEPVDMFEPVSERGQFEDCFDDPASLYPVIDNLVEHLMKKTEAVSAQAGFKEVVLSGELTGMLAHEAVGHTTEADLVRGGSVAGDLVDQQVASSIVNMVDFAHSMNGELLQVPVHIDDEGVEARDAVLIEQGVLKGFMHNRESAAFYDTELTGNARAFTFSDEPLIRMRNTAVLPGNDNLEDMISSVEDGYYLMKTGNGQADSTSEFMFSVTLGYEIKNGQLGRSIQDTTISGIAFDMLKTVDMLSDDMVWNCSGYCGKKQMMPVSVGGPDMKCKVNMGGQ